MKAAVCIATYNRYDALTKTLESVLRSDLSGIEQIIIVDQSSIDMPSVLRTLLHDQALIHYIKEETPSLTKARNIGIKAASRMADIIIFIDDDVEVVPDFFLHHIHCYTAPEILAVGEENISYQKTSGVRILKHLHRIRMMTCSNDY